MVVTDPLALGDARELVANRLAEVDAAASRFRTDFEVSRLAAEAGTYRVISPLLAELIRVALAAAVQTDGAVDPTLGAVMTTLGYGPDTGPATGLTGDHEGEARQRTPTGGPTLTLRRRARWRDVTLSGERLRMPVGTLLDLGATAKAWAADCCAVEVAAAFGCGAMVSLGGDLRVAGRPPEGGWSVLVGDGPGEPADTIRLTGARAVATSSTLHRRWRRGPDVLHHILDPASLWPAPAVWRTVTVATDTCVRATP